MRHAQRKVGAGRRGVFCLAVALTAMAGQSLADDDTGTCGSEPSLQDAAPSGWGIDPRNTRFQPDTVIDAGNVARLALKWVYGLATEQPRSWPLVTADTIFIGDSGDGLLALDRETGCLRWRYPHDGQIGSAILHHRIGERDALLFASRTGGIYAVDATDGELIWHRVLSEPPVPMYSGTPLVQGDSLFVPVSSMEIGLTINPLYGCCTTSGAMARLASATGELLWYRPTIGTPAEVTGRHLLMVEEHGPSGAPVWGPPTLDAERQLIYFGTGQNYSQPATDTSDAIFAVDMHSGDVRWVRQFTAGDAYNIACDVFAGHPNCPDPVGPDWDFGAPPMLIRHGGRDLLIAGQKSGDVHAMDPATGQVLWTRRIGRGGVLGGVHWGMAANEDLGLVMVPVSDIEAHPSEREPEPGLHALEIATGEIRWVSAREPRCEDRVCKAGVSAAVTATADLVFAASMDGILQAHRADTGDVLWSHDSWQGYDAVNGAPANGGTFDAHGPLVIDDLVIVSSGYATFGQKPGNALLVFQLQPEATP